MRRWAATIALVAGMGLLQGCVYDPATGTYVPGSSYSYAPYPAYDYPAYSAYPAYPGYYGGYYDGSVGFGGVWSGGYRGGDWDHRGYQEHREGEVRGGAHPEPEHHAAPAGGGYHPVHEEAARPAGGSGGGHREGGHDRDDQHH